MFGNILPVYQNLFLRKFVFANHKLHSRTSYVWLQYNVIRFKRAAIASHQSCVVLVLGMFASVSVDVK